MKRIFDIVFLSNQIAGYGLAALYIVILLYILPICYIMPMYGFLGAWDEQSIEDFRKAAIMSGPSRFLVNLLYRGTKFGYQHSPWKGKFVIPSKIAMKQAEELTQMRETVAK
jgi:hypothetical protein